MDTRPNAAINPRQGVNNAKIVIKNHNSLAKLREINVQNIGFLG
jgi:hypothetical protein